MNSSATPVQCLAHLSRDEWTFELVKSTIPNCYQIVSNWQPGTDWWGAGYEREWFADICFIFVSYLVHICRLQNDTWWYPCHDCPRRVFWGCDPPNSAPSIKILALKNCERVSWVSHVMMSCQCHMTVSCTGCDSVAALHFQHDHDCHWRNVQWIPRDIIETYRNYFKIRSPPQRLTKRHNAFKHLFQHH